MSLTFTTITYCLLGLSALTLGQNADQVNTTAYKLNLDGTNRIVAEIDGFHAFRDITVCSWVRPFKNASVVFVFQTDDSREYLALKMDIPNQKGTFVYARASIPLNMTGIVIDVWTHICITTETEEVEEAGTTQEATTFYVYINDSLTSDRYNRQRSVDQPPNGVEGRFVLGQEEGDFPEDWNNETSFAGRLFNFNIWDQSKGEVFDDATMDQYKTHSCVKKPGNLMNVESVPEWDFLEGASYQDKTMPCEAIPPFPSTETTPAPATPTSTPATPTSTPATGTPTTKSSPGVVGGVVNTVGGLVNATTGVLGGVVGGVGNTLGNVVGGVGSVVSGAGNALSTVLGGLASLLG